MKKLLFGFLSFLLSTIVLSFVFTTTFLKTLTSGNWYDDAKESLTSYYQSEISIIEEDLISSDEEVLALLPSGEIAAHFTTVFDREWIESEMTDLSTQYDEWIDLEKEDSFDYTIDLSDKKRELAVVLGGVIENEYSSLPLCDENSTESQIQRCRIQEMTFQEFAGMSGEEAVMDGLSVVKDEVNLAELITGKITNETGNEDVEVNPEVYDNINGMIHSFNDFQKILSQAYIIMEIIGVVFVLAFLIIMISDPIYAVSRLGRTFISLGINVLLSMVLLHTFVQDKLTLTLQEGIGSVADANMYVNVSRDIIDEWIRMLAWYAGSFLLVAVLLFGLKFYLRHKHQGETL